MIWAVPSISLQAGFRPTVHLASKVVLTRFSVNETSTSFISKYWHTQALNISLRQKVANIHNGS